MFLHVVSDCGELNTVGAFKHTDCLDLSHGWSRQPVGPEPAQLRSSSFTFFSFFHFSFSPLRSRLVSVSEEGWRSSGSGLQNHESSVALTYCPGRAGGRARSALAAGRRACTSNVQPAVAEGGERWRGEEFTRQTGTRRMTSLRFVHLKPRGGLEAVEGSGNAPEKSLGRLTVSPSCALPRCS